MRSAWIFDASASPKVAGKLIERQVVHDTGNEFVSILGDEGVPAQALDGMGTMRVLGALRTAPASWTAAEI